METNNLSFDVDDWLDDVILNDVIWIVELSDGSIVYQDDDRPGVYPHSAWERLGNYCQNTGLSIKAMTLRFRSHFKEIGRDTDGFFFSKCISGGFGGFRKSYLTGTLIDGILRVDRWDVPTLVRVPFIDDQLTQIRDVEEAGICLIKNTNPHPAQT